MHDLTTVGKRIRYARQDLRKLKQKELASAAGIKQPSLSELETGETKEITGAVLVALAKALRVRSEWLMTGEQPIEGGTTEDEQELLERYRNASGRWKIAIRYMASMQHDVQQEEAVSYLMSKIFATPVPDEKVEAAYGFPPGRHPLARLKQGQRVREPRPQYDKIKKTAR